jgi:hypothetical protein
MADHTNLKPRHGQHHRARSSAAQVISDEETMGSLGHEGGRRGDDSEEKLARFLASDQASWGGVEAVPPRGRLPCQAHRVSP